MFEYFDTHAHLDDEQFDAIRDDVVARAQAAGVRHVIAVGTDEATSRTCVKLAATYSGVFAAVGIQPNNAAQASPQAWDEIVKLAAAPGVVALGETGLDRYWNYTPFDVQQDYFDRHLRLSQATEIPFIVHLRDCEEDILVMLREARLRGPLSGVMHSFTGTAEGAAECVSLGMYISFAGMVTYKKAGDLRRAAATIPGDRLLIETDAPYLSPEPKRGTRPNEPALVVHTAACLAEVRGVSLEELALATTANAKRLFNRVR